MVEVGEVDLWEGVDLCGRGKAMWWGVGEVDMCGEVWEEVDLCGGVWGEVDLCGGVCGRGRPV